MEVKVFLSLCQISQIGGIGTDYGFNLVDVSIGKRLQSEWFQISHFIGPAYVYGIRRNYPDPDDNFKTVGIQMETQVLFRLANEVGVYITYLPKDEC